MIKYYDILEQNGQASDYHDDKNVLINRFFINPDGYIYNCLGKNSHREANLINTYEIIKKSFETNNYGCLYSLIKEEYKTYKRIISGGITKEDIYKYLSIDYDDINDPFIIELIIGAVTSKICFLNKFIELKDKSKNPMEDLSKIIEYTEDDIRDVLIKYCGFHKIESQLTKTITTACLDLKKFDNYFKKDWCINIEPKLDIENNNTDLNYISVIVERFLEKNPDYKGQTTISNRLMLYK